MNLKHLLQVQLHNVPRWVVIVAFVIALIGFTDATYLSLKYFQGEIPPCTISGCETVLASGYSAIAGIPVALMGAIFYLAILVGLVMYFDTKNLRVLRNTLYLTVLGLLSAVWFTAVQAFILKAFCQYCLLSAVTSTLLFVIAIIVFSKYRAPATLSA